MDDNAASRRVDTIDEKIDMEKIISESCLQLCAALAHTDDPSLIRDFFDCLFTSSEIREFSLRWALVREILAGTTQREIARKFNMSLCKITRGSKELKKENSPFKKMFEVYAASRGQNNAEGSGSSGE